MIKTRVEREFIDTILQVTPEIFFVVVGGGLNWFYYNMDPIWVVSLLISISYAGKEHVVWACWEPKAVIAVWDGQTQKGNEKPPVVVRPASFSDSRAIKAFLV